MKEEDNKIQLIEDYLNDQLSVQEKVDFQQQLQQDPSLAQEVDLYRNIFTGLAMGGRKEMKAHFKALDEEAFRLSPSEAVEMEAANLPSEKVIKPIWQRNAWLTGLAACFVLGLFAIIWLTRANSTEDLFAQYYFPYQNVIDAVERGETTEDATKLAMQAYENEDYERAIQGLQQVLNANPNAAHVYLYLGISYIETNQLDNAKNYLEKAAADTASGLHTQARWYLALAHLKNKDKDQAKTQLQSLSRGNDVYAQKAQQLLDEL